MRLFQWQMHLDAKSFFIRPSEPATDESTTYDVAVHAIDSLDDDFDILVKGKPTSPLRISEDIDNCIEYSLSTGSCVSLVETNKSPYWMYRLPNEHSMIPLLEPEKGF